MDQPHGYGSWTMQPNSNPELAWHLGPSDPSQNIMQTSMPSLYASSASSSSDPAASSIYPGFVGNHHHAFQQHQQQHHLLQHYQSSQYPQQQVQQQQVQQYQAAATSLPPASTTHHGDSMSVDAATMRGLQALFPDAPPNMLRDAALHSHPSMAMRQVVAPSYSQQPSHQDVYSAQSDHTLANALDFTRPSSAPQQASPNPLYAYPQSASPLPPASNHVSNTPQTNNATPQAQANASASDEQPNKKATSTKLRQSELTFLLGIASSVSKEAPRSIPAPIAIPPTQAVSDLAFEPTTPPIPPAKALVTKPTAGGASIINGVTKASAVAPASVDSLLWTKAKQPLSRLSVERSPEASARQLVQMLCQVDSDGKFRNPISTGAEVRKTILETLNAIATLEKGRGFTEHGRKKFFGTWMSIPGGRHVLATWLKQTVPPKKVSEGTADMSRRYKETLMPLLSILDFVDIKKAYLTDEAGLGKAITGVSLRAVDPTARKLAEKLKAKWTKVIDAEESTRRPALTSASTSASTAASSSSSTAAAKRKPRENSGTSETSTKRYKSAASTPSTASGARTTTTAKSTRASAASNAKLGLPFFASGTTIKKPAGATGPSSSAGSSRAGSGSSSAGGAGRMKAHQSVMSLMDKISGGNASDRAAAGRKEGEGSSASAQEKKKVKKRVSWKDDSELVAVKLIEPADYGQDEEEDFAETAAQTAAVDGHDEGLALRQSVSTMEEQMDWQEPREVLVPMIVYEPVGSESVEGPFQTQRNAQLEEKVYEEGQEPESPDESQLKQPGSTSDTPAELKDVETVEIPTPWMDEEVEERANEVEQTGHIDSEGDVKIESGPRATRIDVGALLANIKPVLSAANGLSAAPGPAASWASTSASSSASAAPPSFDANQIRSLLDATEGSGPTWNAVNAAMASQNMTSGNLSALLASLSSTVNGSQATAPSGVQGGSSGGGWDQGQHAYGAGANNRVQESYPGEYNRDYTQSSSQHCGQPSRSYDYNNAQSGWDSEGLANYGGGSSNYSGSSHTRPCKFFAQGNCFRGDSCRFRHG
ncbi:uncharacterized protein UHOD_08735 [Ustilago sp. UG-2017b]|nr:uncharacterized protein UHOD_08735 [Ustilago sp. UG-2017b]